MHCEEFSTSEYIFSFDNLIMPAAYLMTGRGKFDVNLVYPIEI